MTAQAPYESPEALSLAMRFHETYERLAPSFGYETRTETRAFDPTTPNGRLMVAVCGELLAALPERAPVSAGGDAVSFRWHVAGAWSGWSADWTQHDLAKRMGYEIEYSYPSDRATPAPPVGADWAAIGWKACRRQVFALCEHTQDSVGNTPYENGRRHEAKGIARAMNAFGPESCDILAAALAAAPAPAEARGVGDGDLLRDAMRWRAVVGCARVRLLGSAGLTTDADPYGTPWNGRAHIGLELWTKHEEPSKPQSVEAFTKYADKAVEVMFGDAALAAKDAVSSIDYAQQVGYTRQAQAQGSEAAHAQAGEGSSNG